MDVFFSFAGGFFHAEKKNLPLEMVGNNCPLKVTAYSFINCRLVYAVRQAECNCSANQLLLHYPFTFLQGRVSYFRGRQLVLTNLF